MSVWLLTWNPDNWEWKDLKEAVKTTNNKQHYKTRWSCLSKKVQIGDRIFLMKTGNEPRGLVASGYAVSESYEDSHYDSKKSAEGKKASYINVEFEKILDYETEEIILQDDLKKKFDIQTWSPMGSGIEIKPEISDKVIKIWDDKYGTIELNNRNLSVNEEEIDCLGVLKFLENYHGKQYIKPEKVESPQKEKFETLKNEGGLAIEKFNKMAECCCEYLNIVKDGSNKWLDGSNRKVRNYLWIQMKEEKFNDSPESVSLVAEMSKETGNARFRVSLDIKDANASREDIERHNRLLDWPIDKSTGLVYLVGGNSRKNGLEIINETADEIRKKLETGIYTKVQIAYIIEKTPEMTNAQIMKMVIESSSEIKKIYDYIFDYGKEGFYPSLDEYDPGIDTITYENLLSDESVVNRNWLDILYFLYKMGGVGTCKQIANEYGNVPGHYNLNGINIAKEIQKETGCTIFKRQNGKDAYWPILFYGKDLRANGENGIFTYKLREPLFYAIKSMDEKGVFNNMIENIINNRIERTNFDLNIILYGPPGTGKTYNTAIYAVAICDGKELTELTDYNSVMERYRELIQEKRIDFTTFHQSYSYEEFIEGIKPELDNSSDKLEYTIESGVFKRFCEEAEKLEIQSTENSKPYVFIIDEINRGNMSKIFGELITLIESTKRKGAHEAIQARLPYSGEVFSVPKNVYIIGTMNTADRSIALMDTALRRRFRFIEMMPKVDVLRSIGADKVKVDSKEIDVSIMLEKINERIEYLFDREHTIGHAFFTSLKDDPSIDNLASIFEKSVIPLLQEYFYEDYSKIQMILGDNDNKIDDKYKFIVSSKINAQSIFKGDVSDIDLPDYKYNIVTDNFKNAETYIKIYSDL